jgi:hypothetical protein
VERQLEEGAEMVDVTLYCNWSQVAPEWRELIQLPSVSVAGLERTLDNLERAVLSSSVQFL